MPFAYCPPTTEDRLVQGEVLGPLIEYVPLQPPVELAEGEGVQVRGVRYERAVVLTQDCDLLQDFRLRRNPDVQDPESDPRSVPHVLLCEMFEDLRQRVAGGDIFKRAKRNQDERYHAFPEAQIGQDEAARLPDLYLDFRKSISLPTRLVYEALEGGQVNRLAVLPMNYLHDLTHRFHGYHARIAIEE